MSRQQRLRQEKGLEKAEQNLDKLSKKIEDSTAREKVIKSRGVSLILFQFLHFIPCRTHDHIPQ